MDRPREGRASAPVTALLAAAAAIFLGFRLTLALGAGDVDPYESPLILSVARQLVDGPAGLYGPFGGSNPLVLIHAPLYYRVAALLAWPLARAGLHPADAARIAGRTLSAVGLLATLTAAYRLGRVGGLPPRAGWWSAMLVGASPILAGLPFAVRPDMMGVALQTWGIVLALESTDGDRLRSVWASVLFGLSVCVKQHLAAAWVVSVAMRSPADRVRLVLPGMAVAGCVYGAEWVVTGGRIWESAFIAASQVGRVHPGDWLHVATVLAAMAGKGAGLGAMAAAGVAARRRGGLAAVASLVVVAIAMLAVAQLMPAAGWVTLALPVVVAVGVMGVLVDGGSSSPADRRVDSALRPYLVAEGVALAALCRSSSGGWINYGIPAMIDAAVLAARAMSAGGESQSRGRRAVGIAAAVAVLASVLMDVKVEATRRRAERAALARVFSSSRLPSSAFYFEGRPGLNRVGGRLELVFDDWLYPVFESRKLAEPRGRWLPAMLGRRGGVRAVVRESDDPRLHGDGPSLDELGFVPAGRSGPFRVWVRAHAPTGLP